MLLFDKVCFVLFIVVFIFDWLLSGLTTRMRYHVIFKKRCRYVVRLMCNVWWVNIIVLNKKYWTISVLFYSIWNNYIFQENANPLNISIQKLNHSQRQFEIELFLCNRKWNFSFTLHLVSKCRKYISIDHLFYIM